MKAVESNMEIRAEPDAVIRAFTDPNLLRSWWAVERTLIELKAGGLYIKSNIVNESLNPSVITGSINSRLKGRGSLHQMDTIYG